MSDTSKEVRRQKAKLAAATRHYPQHDHHELKRDLAAATLEAWITAVVSKAPPFSQAQRDKLAGLLQSNTRENRSSPPASNFPRRNSSNRTISETDQ